LLGVLSLAIAIGIGLLAGLLATWRFGSVTDLLVRIACLTIYSLPTFWLGLLAIMALSFALPLFPPGHLHSIGYRSAPVTGRILDVLHHTALPASVLGASLAPAIARLARRSLIETMSHNFITAARARGLSRSRVLFVHVLPQSLAPVAQIIGLSLPLLAGGVLVTEVVFSWPGMGRLTHQALMTRDYPVVLAATALCTIAVSAGSALADILHAILDPRVARTALSAVLPIGHRPHRFRSLRFRR
jgi:peptide/nickel transport system permease protein